MILRYFHRLGMCVLLINVRKKRKLDPIGCKPGVSYGLSSVHKNLVNALISIVPYLVLTDLAYILHYCLGNFQLFHLEVTAFKKYF